MMTVFAAMFGACVGSFLNVCIYRIPKDLSVVKPRSFCMTCQSMIPWYHNIPVLSYFLLRGKCAKCGAAFSFRYAFVELLTAMLFVTVCTQYPPIGSAPILGAVRLPSLAMVPITWVFLGGLIVATFVDLDHLIIPDSVTWGGMATGLILSAIFPEMHRAASWHHGLMWSGIGLAVGFGILEAIAILGKLAFKKEAMGFGDVKLMGAVGAFFGWQAATFTIMFAAIIGSVVGVALIASKRGKLGVAIPFGPYLAMAAAVWVFWGPRMVHLYATVLKGIGT